MIKIGSLVHVENVKVYGQDFDGVVTDAYHPNTSYLYAWQVKPDAWADWMDKAHDDKVEPPGEFIVAEWFLKEIP